MYLTWCAKGEIKNVRPLRRRLSRAVTALTMGALLGALPLAGPSSAADGPPTATAPTVATTDIANERHIKVYLQDKELKALRAEGRQKEAAARAAGRTGPQAPPHTTTAQQNPHRTAAEPVAPSPSRARSAVDYFGAVQSQARRAAAQDGAKSQGVQSALALEPPPAIGEKPDQGAVDRCFANGSADNEFGHIYNRFVYCKRFRTDADYYLVRPNRPPEKVGTTSFTYEMFALGDSQNRRVRLFARIQKDSVDYDWGWWDNIWLAPNIRLGMIGQCGEPFEICSGTRGPATLPYAVWDNSTDWYYWDIQNRETAGVGRDKISLNQFFLEWESTDPPFTTIQTGRSHGRVMRCDSGDYFNKFPNLSYPKACVFAEVTSRLTFDSRDDNINEVAEHIRTAQNNPNATWPKLVPEGQPQPRDKRIPGKYEPTNPNAVGLHRITEKHEPGWYKANRDHVRGACYKEGDLKDLYWDTGLPNRPIGGLEECDEYPMASTLEGAAHPDWDFSVRAVDKDDNGRAGNALQDYYVYDRVLSWDPTLPPEIKNDLFFVEII
ncbi:hypothetical protein [Streptomyces sp. NPDC046939]|uniref:NucA/NucB deoxyribonuclease domain-containing protein n=1 Tax=Streptomyces sp. NPDC046939 TaxID=3155376 RepID=UPI0033E80D61